MSSFVLFLILAILFLCLARMVAWGNPIIRQVLYVIGTVLAVIAIVYLVMWGIEAAAYHNPHDYGMETTLEGVI